MGPHNFTELSYRATVTSYTVIHWTTRCTVVRGTVQTSNAGPHLEVIFNVHNYADSEFDSLWSIKYKIENVLKKKH